MFIRYKSLYITNIVPRAALWPGQVMRTIVDLLAIIALTDVI